MINKICFALGHPAHFHLYKHLIWNLKTKGFEVYVFITDKDILSTLLASNKIEFINLCDVNIHGTYNNKIQKLIKSTRILYQYIKEIKPDIIIGCLSQIGYIGSILGIPTIFNAEDDLDYTLLQGILTYPFVKHIVTPTPTRTGIFKYKTIRYEGYHKLAYLHPTWFKPDRNKVDIPIGERYFLLRFAKLNAHHDRNAQGLSDTIAETLIKKLSGEGRVLITSERQLPLQFEKYKFTGNINDMHHYLFFADLFIGDSQSMAVEAAILGTPNIRFNTFVGKISVLDELENKYQLTKGIPSKFPQKLFEETDAIIKDLGIKSIYEEKRNRLISEKIDVTDFLTRLIMEYPRSIKTFSKR